MMHSARWLQLRRISSMTFTTKILVILWSYPFSQPQLKVSLPLRLYCRQCPIPWHSSKFGTITPPVVPATKALEITYLGWPFKSNVCASICFSVHNFVWCFFFLIISFCWLAQKKNFRELNGQLKLIPIKKFTPLSQPGEGERWPWVLQTKIRKKNVQRLDNSLSVGRCWQHHYRQVHRRRRRQTPPTEWP